MNTDITPEDMFAQRRLSGMARQMGGIVRNLEEFKVEYPTIIAPNVIDAMIGNLKDDINILLREVNMLSSPNRRELQQRRYVCRSCQSVFMVPLVAGICDECRSRGITSQEVVPEPPSDDEASADELSVTDESSEDDPFADEDEGHGKG